MFIDPEKTLDLGITHGKLRHGQTDLLYLSVCGEQVVTANAKVHPLRDGSRKRTKCNGSQALDLLSLSDRTKTFACS